MAMPQQHLATTRLMDLERVVDMLNRQLRALQRDLQHQKYGSLAERIRINLAGFRRHQIFMSTVCNQHFRPNIKGASRSTSRTLR